MTVNGQATTQQQYKELIKFHSSTSLKAIEFIQKSYISTGKLRKSLQNKKVFTIADYGCSTGTMSIDILRQLITQIRKSQQEPALIRLIMNDLPHNDFNLLHQNLKNGLGDLFDQNVEIFDKPISFYQKVAQKGQVDFGFSIYTSHWLSKQPSSHLQNSVWAIEQNSQQIYKKWEYQAHQDFKLFLERRIEEMKDHSYVLIINIGNQNSDMRPGSSHQTYPGSWSQLLGQKQEPEEVEKILKRMWELQFEYLTHIENHPQNPEKYYLQAIQLLK